MYTNIYSYISVCLYKRKRAVSITVVCLCVCVYCIILCAVSFRELIFMSKQSVTIGRVK